MSDIQTLYERNRRFAERFPHASLDIKPKMTIVILSCMDARIDPAHFLGLEPGEAIVLRNAGGRITEEIERDLAILWTMMEQVADAPPRLSLAIIHHGDCGLERLADPQSLQMVSKGTVNLGRYLPDLQHEIHPISLSRAPISTRNHQSCRLALLQIRYQPPRC